jgi:hypothetical protein
MPAGLQYNPEQQPTAEQSTPWPAHCSHVPYWHSMSTPACWQHWLVVEQVPFNGLHEAHWLALQY